MYGKEIKEARITRGVTQKQVSNATGLPQNTISWIELDKGIPNIQQCIMLAKYYECTLEELIGNTDIPRQEQTKALPSVSSKSISFAKEFEDIVADKNFESIAKLYKAITPELRALTLGYIVGVLQSNGVNTKNILGY